MDNLSVIYAEAAKFAGNHMDEDPDRLLLNADKWPGIDMKTVVSTIVSCKKLRSKAPLWAHTPALVFPKTLSAQQCSSEIAARHKARLAETYNPVSIADLTGGIGVDSLEFSRICPQCHYNEADPALSAAAKYNFQIIKEKNKDVYMDNIFVTSYLAAPDEHDFMMWLQNVSPDMVFLDPARRDSAGRKVFLLEDCSPDITKLKESLFEISPLILLKLSPMADISMLLSRLKNCERLQVVEYAGECREILLVLRRGYVGDCLIEVVDLDAGDDALMSFSSSSAFPPPALAGKDDLVAGNYLFEPSKAMMKAGCFGLLSKILDAACVGSNSHYYILTPGKLEQLGDSPVLRSGRLSRILETSVLSGSSIKSFGRKYPEAETLARDVHFSSAELRNRLGCRPSDSIRIFALGAERAGGKVLIAAKRVFGNN